MSNPYLPNHQPPYGSGNGGGAPVPGNLPYGFAYGQQPTQELPAAVTGTVGRLLVGKVWIGHEASRRWRILGVVRCPQDAGTVAASVVAGAGRHFEENLTNTFRLLSVLT